MFARVTLAEIDVVRISIASALELYRDSVLPALHDQPGYEGGYVLATPEGKALVMTFWASAEDAEAGFSSGFYGEQVQKFATVYRAQPGRELYEVVLAEAPGASGSGDASAQHDEARTPNSQPSQQGSAASHASAPRTG